MSVFGSSPRVAVVIPFYQRKAGILPGAVRSALAQTDVKHVEIVVVDNCSPAPAIEDLEPFLAEHGDQIRLIHQPHNRGPGGARNAALNALAPDTDYVAFLDSDDAWEADHLSRALDALGQGYDFYFADFLQLGQTVSAFRRRGHLDPSRHRSLAGGSDLHEYEGDIFAQTLTRNVIGTSTVVYRRSACPDLRFEEAYSHAGEDYLFWLDFSTRSRRVTFSSRIECTYGPGVNVYSGSGWGTEGALRRLHCEIKYLRSVPRRYRLSRALASHVKHATRRLRRAFVAETLHRLKHRKPMDRKLLQEHLRADFWTGALFVPLALAITVKGLIKGARRDDGA